jgi:hypothetical protein
VPSALLEHMRRNPAGDWHIDDVEASVASTGFYSVPDEARHIATPSIRPRVKS